MKIAISGVAGFGGGAPLTTALATALRTRGHDVEIFYYNNVPAVYARGQRIRALVDSRTPLERYAPRLAASMAAVKPDVVVAIEGADVLLHDFSAGTKKVFLPQAPLSSEAYFSLSLEKEVVDLARVRQLRDREISAYEASDLVFFAWKTYEQYVRRFVYDKPNIVPAEKHGWFGCDPSEKLVGYEYPFSIAFLGSLGYAWINKDLLAWLTRESNYVIEVWGGPEPDEKYGLRYRGVAPSHDVLYDYQFGLVTVSKDPVRRMGFSSKILTYLSLGMPCLFPEWHECGNDLGGCIPYEEDNFDEVLEAYQDRAAWQAKSSEAIEQARQLSWPKVLAPMVKAIEQL